MLGILNGRPRQYVNRPVPATRACDLLHIDIRAFAFIYSTQDGSLFLTDKNSTSLRGGMPRKSLRSRTNAQFVRACSGGPLVYLQQNALCWDSYLMKTDE